MATNRPTQMIGRSWKGLFKSCPPSCFFNFWMYILMIPLFVRLVASTGPMNQGFNDSRFSNGSSASIRIHRSAEKLEKAIQQLGHLSRISNGISLEIGLATGEINSEDAVADFLHMGSVTIQDITDLNEEAIEKLLKVLDQSAKPQLTKPQIMLEDRLANLDGLRQIAPKFKDILNLPGQKKLSDGLPKVNDLSGFQSTLEAVKTQLGVIVPMLNNLKKADGSKIDMTANNMMTISYALDELESHTTSFDSIAEAATKVKEIPEKSKFVTWLLEEDKYRTLLSVGYDYAPLPTVLENLQGVYEGTEMARKSEVGLKNIRKLTDVWKDPKLTAGFPRGSIDVLLLSKDVVDPWVTSRVSNSKLIKNGLENAFKPYKQLGESLGSVEAKWKFLKNQTIPINNFINVALQLVQIPDHSSAVSGVVDQLMVCEFLMQGFPASGMTELKRLSTPLESLNKRIEKISGFGYLSQLKDVTKFKKFFNNENMSTEQKTILVKETLAKLKSDGDLQNFVKHIHQFSEDIQRLLDFLKDPIPSIDLTIATKHQQSLNKPKYRQFLGCLSNINVKEFPLKAVVPVVQKFRKFSVSAETKSAILQLTKSKNDLANTKKSPEKFDPKPAELLRKSFKNRDSRDVAFSLGMGVQGLMAINRAQKSDFKDILDEKDDLVKNAKQQNLGQNWLDTLEKLNQIPQVLKEVDDFLKSSNGLQSFRRKRNSNFQSVQKIFDELSSLKGVSIDRKSLMEAIEVLAKANPKKYDKLVTSDLDRIDLDFARFNIKNAVGSLGIMDEFFAEYSNILTNSPQAAGGSPDGSGGPQQSAGNAGAESPEYNPTIGWIKANWYYFFIPLAIIAVTVFLIWLWRKKPKPKPKPNPQPSPVIQIVGPPPPPPAVPAVNPPPQVDDPPPRGPEVDARGEDIPDVVIPMAEFVPAAAAPPPRQVVAPENQPEPVQERVEQNERNNADEQLEPTQVGDDDSQELAKNVVARIISASTVGISPDTWAQYELDKLDREGLRALKAEDMTGLNERRHSDNYCLNGSMAKVAGKFINFNIFQFTVFKLIVKWFCGQGPLDGTGCDKNRVNKGKKDTRDKHIGLIEEQNIGVIAQLCSFVNEEIHKRARYYLPRRGDTVDFGIYKVTSTEKFLKPIHLPGYVNAFVLYKLEYLNSQTKKTGKMDTLLFTGWSDRRPPSDPEPALAIIKFCEQYKKNVMVHCPSGQGRSGTLIAIKYGIEKCQREITGDASDIIRHIRSIRYGAVQTPAEYLYMILCITKGVMNERGIAFSRDYCALEYFYRKIISGGYKRLHRKDKYKNSEKGIQFLKKDLLKMEAYVEKKEQEYRASLEGPRVVPEHVEPERMGEGPSAELNVANVEKMVAEQVEQKAPVEPTSGTPKGADEQAGASTSSQSGTSQGNRDFKVKE